MEQKTERIIVAQKLQKFRQDMLIDGIVATAPVVMLSGSFGSGVGELAEKLSHHARVPFYGPRRLEALSNGQAQTGTVMTDSEGAEEDFFDYWLGYLREGTTISARDRFLRLSHTIREIATRGGIIAGVCSHMVLPGKKLLRVRVDAGTQFCARRLAATRGIQEAEATRAFLQLEGERRQFLNASFAEAFTDSIEYDLVLNAEQSTLPDMLDTCLAAMDRKGMLGKTKKHRSAK
ncbi:MAG: cytidylate kinase-like family protein [Magnetococcus sp. DMHC-8]